MAPTCCHVGPCGTLFFTLTTLTLAILTVFGGKTLLKELLGFGYSLSCISTADISLG